MDAALSRRRSWVRVPSGPLLCTSGRLRSDDNSFGDYHVTNYTTLVYLWSRPVTIWHFWFFRPAHKPLCYETIKLVITSPTVTPVGLEPTTPALKVRCSKPSELRSHFGWHMGFEPIPQLSQSWMLTATTMSPFCGPGGLRSHSPHIKSMVLSRLSYESNIKQKVRTDFSVRTFWYLYFIMFI